MLHISPNGIEIHLITFTESSTSLALQKVFDKYPKLNRTQAQLADHNELRINSASIQKMMKDCSLIDAKYTSQLLNNDIVCVLGKLAINSNDTKSIHYRKRM